MSAETSTSRPSRLVPLAVVLGGAGVAALSPGLGVDPRLAALVGMAAMFTGASRALLASVVFAFDPRGAILRTELHDGVIRSAARLSYGRAQAMVDGDT